jgi:hypothetical protein
MIRLFVLSVAILASFLNTFADNRNRSEMLRIAQEKFATKSMAKGSSIIDNEVKLMKDTDQFAIYGAKGSGFIVVSRSNTFPAIIGESTHDFDSANIAPGFKWWMENISKSLAYRDANNMGRTAISVSTTIYPFITTKWNQDTPYNLLCPKVGSLTHGYTGCVATAMSQILKYYNYPSTSKGSGGYSTVVGNDTIVRLATINTTYEWNNMSNSYLTSNAITPTNIAAVATLMRDAGYGANMEYGVDGSGTTDYEAAISFVNNFSYNPFSLKFLQKALYTDDEWAQIIYNEIKNKRPILYGGSTKTNEGHAFVFDGINTDGNVDVNWGWGGACDGWYDIFDLTPIGLGDEFSSGTTFSEGNDMILGFDPTSTASGSDFSIWATDNNCEFTKTADNKLNLTMTAFYNVSYKSFTGDVAVIYENTTTNDLTVTYFAKSKTYATYSGLGFDNENTISLDAPNIQAGSYKVYIASKATNETSWSPVRSFITHDVISYTLTKASDGGLTLTGIDKVINKKENSDKIKRIYDISGRLIDTTTEDNAITTKGIYIIKQGSDTKKIMKP